MALKKKTTARITKAMKRFVSWLKYRSVGPHALTKAELKDLARAGLITSTKGPTAAVAKAYLLTHENIAPEPAPKSVREGAIDFLERSFNRYAEKAGAQFTTDLLSQLEAQIMPFVDRQEGKSVYDLIRDKDIHAKRLGKVLHGVVNNWYGRWKTIVNTELARASNFGAMDAIIHNNPDKQPHELTVYKIGPNDGAVCDECRKFWFMDDGRTPRVYKLSELMSNGTNIGRSRKEWKPTVDNTHPNERHLVLQHLEPGYGFINGSLQYVTKDHDEFKKQRG